MFEGQPQESIETLMKANPEFRQLYYRHQELDRKTAEAGIGVLPLDDATLGSIKREKLQLKQQLNRIYADLSH